MDMPESQSVQNSLHRNAERHFDYHNFDALLLLASETCLRKAPNYTISNELLTPEQRLVVRLGTRGLSIACDWTAKNNDVSYALRFSSDDEGNEAYVGSTIALRSPDLTGVEVNHTVQRKIEVFGAALLDEAYISLGTDAKAMVRAYKNAKTADDQLVVLAWLDKRMKDLTRLAPMRQASMEQEHFYHPIFLSPNAMGQYPHHAFEPSCLGKSIVTSSFLYQTGARVLHAGVVKTTAESEFRAHGWAAATILRRAVIPRDSKVNQKLHEVATQVYYDEDPGFHASTLVELADGSWYVVDPNYSTYVLPENFTAAVSEAYEDVSSLQHIARGLERCVAEPGISQAELVWIMLNELDLKFDIETARNVLASGSEETIRGQIHEWVRDQLRQSPYEEDAMNEQLKLIIDFYDSEEVVINDSFDSTYMEEAIDQAFTNYFLWDMSPEEVVTRLSSDRHFMERRMDDLRALPYLALLNCAIIQSDANAPYYKNVHHAFEVGLPAYRIGAAVLSDFATYCGDTLSYSFWVSHWPSRIPITERHVSPQPTHERGIMKNNAVWLSDSLKYTSQDGIIEDIRTEMTKE